MKRFNLGLCVEGIHRISAPKANLDKLEKAVNSRCSIELEDIHDASGLLKRFLRQLPEHVLTNEKRPVFEKIASSMLRIQFIIRIFLGFLLWSNTKSRIYSLALLLVFQ